MFSLGSVEPRCGSCFLCCPPVSDTAPCAASSSSTRSPTSSRATSRPRGSGGQSCAQEPQRLPHAAPRARPCRSYLNIGRRCVYRCTIEADEAGDGPIFCIRAADDPANPIRERSASGAYTALCNRLPGFNERNVKRTRAWDGSAFSFGLCGAQFFGFGHPTIQALIERLPDAERVRSATLSCDTPAWWLTHPSQCVNYRFCFSQQRRAGFNPTECVRSLARPGRPALRPDAPRPVCVRRQLADSMKVRKVKELPSGCARAEGACPYRCKAGLCVVARTRRGVLLRAQATSSRSLRTRWCTSHRRTLCATSTWPRRRPSTPPPRSTAMRRDERFARLADRVSSWGAR